MPICICQCKRDKYHQLKIPECTAGSQTNLLLQIFFYFDDACALHTRGATDLNIVCDFSRDLIEKESKDITDEEEQAVPDLGNGSKCLYLSRFGPL